LRGAIIIAPFFCDYPKEPAPTKATHTRTRERERNKTTTTANEDEIFPTRDLTNFQRNETSIAMDIKNSLTNDVEVGKLCNLKQESKISNARTVNINDLSEISPPQSSEEHEQHQQQQEEEVEENVTILDQVGEKRRSCFVKMTVGALLIAFVIFVIVDSQTNRYVRAGITSFLRWIEDNPGSGVVVFMLVYFAATVLFVPGTILTLGAGFVFSASFGSLGIGILLGVIAVFFGASAGATVSFLFGRYLLRDGVLKLSKKYKIFEALDKAMAEKGLRIMILLRLSPIIPFNAINYIAGVTAISFWKYVMALFAIIPGTTLYVFLGASAGSLAESANSGDNMTITIIVVVVGIVFGIGAIALTSYYAKKELNKAVAIRQAELEAEHQENCDVEETDLETTQRS
jgi:uncharacterized membrane protein YdjX (TVP38/TMEM64 family)